jgi:hypothetical protein
MKRRNNGLPCWVFFASPVTNWQNIYLEQFEEDGVDRVRVRREMKKLHPVKTMFMGVITTPNPEHDFNGLINMKWLSKQYMV